MPSILDKFLIPIRNTFTKAKEATQPLFIDAGKSIYKEQKEVKLNQQKLPILNKKEIIDK